MSRNAENGLLIFVCNIYEIFVMQKCYVIFILQLELSITNILKIFTESGYQHSRFDKGNICIIVWVTLYWRMSAFPILLQLHSNLQQYTFANP